MVVDGAFEWSDWPQALRAHVERVRGKLIPEWRRRGHEMRCYGMGCDGMGGKLPSTRIDRPYEYKRERLARPAAKKPISPNPIKIRLLKQ